MKRKGSLNLSIQTIVIVVLAMTLLGLGLGFIRNQIGTLGETTGTVQQQVQEQITSQLRQSGEKLGFPREISLNKGRSETLALGVQNTGSSTLSYQVRLSWDSDNSDFSDELGDLSNLGDPKNKFFELRWDRSCQELSPAESAVFSINAKSPNKPGTYALKVIVDKVEDCADEVPVGVYGNKLAFVNVG